MARKTGQIIRRGIVTWLVPHLGQSRSGDPEAQVL